MKAKTFTDFKQDFYSKFTDPHIFDCGDFNILKTVQDGLKLRYTFHPSWHYPFFLYRILIFAKRVRLFLFRSEYVKQVKANIEKNKSQSHRRYLLIDTGYVVSSKEGNVLSVFFENFLKILGKNNCIHSFGLNWDYPFEIKYDIRIHDYSDFLNTMSLNEKEQNLLRNLKKTFYKIQKQSFFNREEMSYIKAAIEIFFTLYRAWRIMLTHIDPKIAFIIMHYHNEGCLLALKEKGIRYIELQHGLIAPEDIFYMYPSIIQTVADKALFAEQIWVYGQFWKQCLLQGYEYDESRIKVIGYYHYVPSVSDESINHFKKIIGDKKIILVTTQWSLQDYFTAYTRWLSLDILQKKYNYIIFLKPHPGEEKGIYDELSHLPSVYLINDNINTLFQFTDIHISIYSTTLYDALRYGVKNYALFVEQCADYVHSVVSSGAAELLQFHENPIEKQYDFAKTKIDAQYYFEEFNQSKLTNLLHDIN